MEELITDSQILSMHFPVSKIFPTDLHSRENRNFFQKFDQSNFHIMYRYGVGGKDVHTVRNHD